MITGRYYRSVWITQISGWNKWKIRCNLTTQLRRNGTIKEGCDFEVNLTVWLCWIAGILGKTCIIFLQKITRWLPFSKQGDTSWINRTIWVWYFKGSIHFYTIIRNLLHNEMHLPSTNWKFDRIRITLIFLTSHSKSKIYHTSKVCRWLISRYTRCKIKIYPTCCLSCITRIERKSCCIFFEKIRRLLKWPRKWGRFTNSMMNYKPKNNEITQEYISWPVSHEKIIYIFEWLKVCFLGKSMAKSESMKKILPYTPMFALVIGTIAVQLMNHNASQGLLSNALDTPLVAQTAWYCTQPDKFNQVDETAWCHGSNPEDIVQNYHSWNWSCVRGSEKQSCHFMETGPYKTRSGTFFSK